jgi:hypothetical protein
MSDGSQRTSFRLPDSIPRKGRGGALRRRVVTFVLAALSSASAFADQGACLAVKDMLARTEKLVEALNRHSIESYAIRGAYAADAASGALDAMRYEGWSERALAAAMGVYVSASAFRRGLREPSPGAAELSRFADALAAEAAPRCPELRRR